MSSGPSTTRRAVLTAAVAGACSVAGLGVFGYWLLRQDRPNPVAGADTEQRATTTSKLPEPVITQRVPSDARGREIVLTVMRPEGVAKVDLPVCLALHGRGATGQMFVDLGVPAMLTAAVAAGMPPFAVAAVDGGDSYWIAVDPADDPQRMLTDELPTWLDTLGLVAAPVAVLGISMGAYGAFNYVRTHPGLRSVAVVSPAMFASWTDARARSVFADRAQWEATEPLQHTESMARDKLGLWCGTADPFAPVVRQLVAKVKPATAVIGPGAHDAPYWTRVLPDVLRFVGSHL
jgi:S-formylglutathione hydrolase FrmB